MTEEKPKKPMKRWLDQLTDHILHLVQIDVDFDLDMTSLDSSQCFLHTYKKTDLWSYLKKFGIIETLKKQGFKSLELKTDTSDHFVHQLIITDKNLVPKPNYPAHNFLIQCFARRRLYNVRDFKGQDSVDKDTATVISEGLNFDMELTVIEWLCMQNPTKEFTKERPKLPGQNYPGLGVGRKVHNMQVYLATLKQRDGLLNVPEHFHLALFYFHKGYNFVNPEYQGFFMSLLYDLKADLLEYGLATVSWAMRYLAVKDDKGVKVKWLPQEQIHPISSRTKKYFESDAYKNCVNKHIHRGVYKIDWSDAADAKKYSVHAPSKMKLLIN